MPDTYIHIKPAIEAQFHKCMKRGRVLFFSAPCGFGKTVTARKLIRQTGKTYRSLSGDRVSFEELKADEDWEILFVDDLQMMQEEDDEQALCSLIRENPDRRFVLASRGLPPGCLMAFQYTGLMTVMNADRLLFDRADIRKLFREWKVPVTDSELVGIARESIGHPLGVIITIRLMAEGRSFGTDLVADAFREVFRYFEIAIYRRFDLNIRRFLLELAPFEQFDLDMARIVSGDPRAGETLDWLQRNTTMLRYDGRQKFYFWPQFRAFLQWEMDREYSEEKKKAYEWLQKKADKYKVNISACCVSGIEESRCIDGYLLSDLRIGNKEVDLSEPRKRGLCACTMSTDIGGWPPKKCYSGCKYCYANAQL